MGCLYLKAQEDVAGGEKREGEEEGVEEEGEEQYNENMEQVSFVGRELETEKLAEME